MHQYSGVKGVQAFVHYSVGVSGMLFLLLLVDLDYRQEFLLTFASGFWALVPDLGWLLLRIDMPVAAAVWKATFNSIVGNVFWFHSFIDAHESGDRVVEMTGAFVLLGVAVVAYYVGNDWE